MRIALSVETFLPKIDGISRMACLTLEYFQQWNIEAIILAPRQGVTEYAGTRVIDVPGIVNPKYPEGRVSFPTYNTYRALRDFKPDLVHAIDPATIGAALIFSAKWLGVPTVASYHLSFSESFRAYGLGWLSPVVRKMRLWGFNTVDHALAVSRTAQGRIMGQGVRRVGLWRRGVDSDSFHPRFRSAAMRDELSGGHPDDVLLLYVGRLAPDKQIVQFKTALETIPNVRLALVGGGPYQHELEKVFAGLPVTFAGYKQGQDLAAAYASADMFVFASAHESFGLVLAEAIASGLPVISSRVGGAEDIITHGKSGYLFDRDDTASLTAYIRDLAENPERRCEMGRHARAFAETLRWPDIMRELYDFYEDLLIEKSAARGVLIPNRPKSPMFQPQRR